MSPPRRGRSSRRPNGHSEKTDRYRELRPTQQHASKRSSHENPGEEIIYVLEGSLEYQIGDNAPVTVNAGGVLFVPAGAVHSARNGGTVTGAELATYIVEKGKLLLSLIQ